MKCEICGKSVAFGNKVSHSNRKTNRMFKPNIRRVRVLENGTRKEEDALVAGIFDVMNDVADTYLAGGTYTDAMTQKAIDSLLSTDAMKAVAAVGVRASIGNTFFSHPNREGCQELYDAVIYALEHNSNGTQVLLKEAPNVLVKKPVKALLRSLGHLLG